MNMRSGISVVLFVLTCSLQTQAQGDTPQAKTRHDSSAASLLYYSKYIARENLDSAIGVIRQVIALSEKKHDFINLFEGYFLLGASYFHKNDYGQAIGAYRQALTYSVKTDQPRTNFCRTLNSTGTVFMRQGDYKKAAQYFFRAALIAEEQAEHDALLADQLVRIYNNMSDALIELRDYNKAMFYLNKAEILALKLKHAIRLPSIWNNMAIVYNKNGQTDTAMAYAQKSLQLSRTEQHYHAEYLALQIIGRILLDQNQPLQAIPYLQATLRIRGNVNASYQGNTFYLLGSASLATRDYPKAKHYFRLALQKSKESAAPDIALNVHEKLAALYTATHEYRRAVEHLRASYVLNDSLLNREKIEAVQLMEVKYRTAEKDRLITRNQLQLNIQQRRLQQKNIWIGGITASSLTLAVLLFAIRRHYRHKNRMNAKQQEIDNLRATMYGEEKERARLARELHDGIAGMITAVKMNFIAVRIEHPEAGYTGNFNNAMHLLEETAREIRHTAQNLTPEIINHHELPEAIALFCEKVQNSSGLHISFMEYGVSEALDSNFKLAIYRITQELINNIVKHAQATQAIVQLSWNENLFGLTVEDNGIGIDPALDTGGMGMQNIQSRVKSLDGKFLINTSKDKGTNVYIEFHLPKTAQPL